MKKNLIITALVVALIALMASIYFYIQSMPPKIDSQTIEQLEENERRARLESIQVRIQQPNIMTEEEKIEHEAKLQRLRSLQRDD